MSVGRTIEQLKKRRHAYLGPYIPPAQERNFQHVDPAEEVGQLKGIIGGVKRMSTGLTDRDEAYIQTPSSLLSVKIFGLVDGLNGMSPLLGEEGRKELTCSVILRWTTAPSQTST